MLLLPIQITILTHVATAVLCSMFTMMFSYLFRRSEIDSSLPIDVVGFVIAFPADLHRQSGRLLLYLYTRSRTFDLDNWRSECVGVSIKKYYGKC